MSKPILLVHGAWSASWAWGFVAAELEKHGITPHTIDMPSSNDAGATLSADADSVRAKLAEIGEPTVLLGHSYAGMTITEASAGNANVAHLVYLTAALPQDGDSVGSLMGSDSTPSNIGSAIRMNDDGTSTVDPQGAREILFNDATDEQVNPILPALGPHTMGTFGEAAKGLGWKEHPSTYILTQDDLIFSPELQRSMATGGNANIVEVPGGHIPQLLQAEKIAGVLSELAA